VPLGIVVQLTDKQGAQRDSEQTDDHDADRPPGASSQPPPALDHKHARRRPDHCHQQQIFNIFTRK